jgi:hypothetical protein
MKPISRRDMLAATTAGGLLVAANQWLALTPPELVSAHLKLDQQVMYALRKQKSPIVPA